MADGFPIEDQLKVSDNIEEIVDKTFAQVDTNKNGFIDEKELGQMLHACAQEMGIPSPPKEEVKAVLQKLDRNNDNQLSRDEFRALVVRLYEQSEQMKGK